MITLTFMMGDVQKAVAALTAQYDAGNELGETMEQVAIDWEEYSDVDSSEAIRVYAERESTSSSSPIVSFYRQS